MSPRIALTAPLLLLASALVAQPPLSWPAPPNPQPVRIDWGVPVTLRDGVVAQMTMYHPANATGRLPTILMITPYMVDAFHPTAMYFAKSGYIVAMADTRGRGQTGGEWKPFVNDGTLGYDLVEWIAGQPWSDGQVAMAGLSYLGFTQWTTLKEFPPHLASLVPTASAYFSYTSLHPWNIWSTYAIRWLTGVSGRSVNRLLVGDSGYWDQVLWNWYSNHLPYSALDSVAGNRTTELATWIKHPTLDDYVEATTVRPEDYARISIPILTVTGHFDSEQRAALRHYRRHMQLGNAGAKERHHLIIGPWDHYATFWPRREIGGLTFDSASVVNLGIVHTQWYDWTLKGGPRPEFLRNRVAYYLMGAEEWRYADDLESVTSGHQSLAIASPRGNPSTLATAGSLSTEPARTGPDQWVYDPLDLRPGAWERRLPAGYVTRADSLLLFDAGLVYETAPLTEQLDLAGVPRLRVWLAMDVLDTDFSATLYEITADGRAIFLTSQLQRARYREGLGSEKLMTPGAVTPFLLDDFDFFARRIAAGSRVRLVIAAVNSPQWEKNYNTGGPVAFESGKNARTARVSLYHDPARPSALELPVAAPTRRRIASSMGAGNEMSITALPSETDSADARFRAGDFTAAERLYRAAAEMSPEAPHVLLKLGELAVLSNRFADAERWLGRARGVEPGNKDAARLLAQVYYRQDRFQEAAPLFRAGGNELMARVTEGFGSATPYAIEGAGEQVALQFLQLDPIPVVKVTVNGHDANFILDTGGSEIYLEPHFAEKVGAIVSGSEAGGFAGGQTKPVRKGRVDSVGLDRFTVRNVPVNIVDTKFIGRDQVAPGLEISGFLGTILLYHFLPTIDYPGKQLVLRKRSDAGLRDFASRAASGGQTVLPFWLASDHLIVAWGSVPKTDSALYLVDTGGAGVGFVPGPTVRKEAGIALPQEPTKDEPFVMYTQDQFSLGPFTERNIPSVYGPLPAAMETSLGFKLAGIVSHSFFKPYAVTIDFTGMRLFIARSK